jgi:hypothetical protein
VVPRVSSERRDYIPIGFLGPDTLCSDATLIIPDTTLYHFGVLHCAMHIAWVRYVCGRLKSDYRYSAQIVYNNFSWPGSPRRWAPTKPPQRARHRCATPSNRPRKAVLQASAAHPAATLAQFYDLLTMPAALLRARQALDRAVDAVYRPTVAPAATPAMPSVWPFCSPATPS